MIYLIGGAPRAGKSILCQQVASRLNIGWIATDLLMELLRIRSDHGMKAEWNAAPNAIKSSAKKFFPYFERFVWGVSSMAEGYVIEGVDFLPEHVSQLSKNYRISSVFLGCSEMTLEHFDQFPGRSRGYAFLPEEMRRQIVHDVPFWSEFIRQEAKRFDYPYVDMIGDFSSRLHEAETVLTTNVA